MSKPDSKRVITIGRAADNSVVLESANVSAHHARLIVSPNRIVLEDLQSTNGTSVRTVENKTLRAVVKPEDAIFLGSAEYSVAEILQIAEQSVTVATATPSPTSQTRSAASLMSPQNAIIALSVAVMAMAVLWLGMRRDGGESTVSAVQDSSVAVTAIVAAAVSPENSVTPTQTTLEASLSSDELGKMLGTTTELNSAQTNISVPAAVEATTEETAGNALRDALFVVFCREGKTKTPFRVGTAFAIEDGRVVTAASVILALKTLMANAFTEPTLYSPTLNRSIAIDQMYVHPRFSEVSTQIDAIVDTPDNAEKVVALLSVRTIFDVGYFQTSEELPTGLKLRNENVRPGQKLHVIGYPFDVDDPFFDASLPIETEQLTAGSDVLQFHTDIPSPSFSARIDEQQADQTNVAFIGSPIVDARNYVIGIYVRQGFDTQNSNRFDGSLASRLLENFLE